MKNMTHVDSKHKMVIDNKPSAFEPGETILDVALRNSIYIPTLCHLKGATPTGACRICVVEVTGAPNLVPACATPAADGMVVLSESREVIEARRSIIRLMLSSGHHNCAIRDFDTKDWTQFQLKVLEEDGEQDLCPVWGLQTSGSCLQIPGKSKGASPVPEQIPHGKGQSFYYKGFFPLYPLRPLCPGMQGDPGEQCH